MAVALAVVIAYLLGSIDFGVIVSRARGVDIYREGSGNPGTSNVFRALGKGPAALVMLGDAAKGFAAAAIGSTIGGETVGFACALAATVGHVFPIWHGFRGGRGVATAIGAAIWLEPVLGLALAVGWTSAVVVTRTASMASIIAMLLYVPAFALAGHRGASLALAGCTALLVLVRHAPNIRRLVGGRERRMDAA